MDCADAVDLMFLAEYVFLIVVLSQSLYLGNLALYMSMVGSMEPGSGVSLYALVQHGILVPTIVSLVRVSI